MVDPAALASTLTAPATPLTADEAVRVVREHWGLTSRAMVRLATERDDTFRVDLDRGDRVTLKVAHPADPKSSVDAQLAVLTDLAVHAPHIPVSRVAPSRDGFPSRTVTTAEGPRVARVLTWLDGEPWNARPRGAAAIRRFGAAQARFAQAVAAAGRRVTAQAGPTPAPTPWNLLEVDAARAACAHIADAALRAAAASVLDRAATEVMPELARQPRVLAHNDAHGENVLVAPGLDDAALTVTGFLDFGDLTHTPRIADLAVAASYAAAVADPRDPELAASPWAPAATLVAGAAHAWAEAGEPLTPSERDLIAPLVLLRLAQRAALNSAVAAASSDRARYASRNLARLRDELAALVEHPAPDRLGAAP